MTHSRKTGRKAGAWNQFFIQVATEESTHSEAASTASSSATANKPKGKRCICKFCYNAHLANPIHVPLPKVFAVRKDALVPHLKKCSNVPVSIRPQVESIVASALVPPVSKKISFPAASSMHGPEALPIKLSTTNGASKRAQNPDTSQNHALTKRSRIVPVNSRHGRMTTSNNWVDHGLTAIEEERFQILIAEMALENGLSFEFVESRSWIRLVKFMRPVLVSSLPNQSTLSGRLIQKVALEGYDEEKKGIAELAEQYHAQPGLVIDAFENTSKKHTMGVIVALCDRWWNYDAREFGPRHDAIALSQFVEGVIEELKETQCIDIGSFCSDSEGGIARMRRILSRRWPTMIFSPCFAHIVNCIVGAVLKDECLQKILKAAIDFVTKAHCYPARWLPVINQIITDTYGSGTPLSLLQMVVSRWNSSHQCVASLLRVRSAIKMFVLKNQQDPTFPSEFKCAGSDLFWEGCLEIECLLRPFTRSSLLLQRHTMTYAQVTLSFLNLYQVFSTYNGPEESRLSLLEIVERYWRQYVEQPLAMLALFLHPDTVALARKLPSDTDLTSITDLAETAVSYFKRFFPGVPPGKLRGDFVKWYNRSLTKVEATEFDSWLEFWSFLLRGAPELAKLALKILSAVVQSATCEQLFSLFLSFHSKRRNRLGAKKVFYSVQGERVVQRKNEEEIMKENEARGLRPGDIQQNRSIRLVNPTEREIESDICYTQINIGDVPEIADAEEKDDVDADENDFHDIDTNLETAFTAMIQYETEQRDRDENDSLVMDLRLADDNDENLRPPFPDFNDKNFPQDSVLSTFRGKKLKLSSLVVNDTVNWEEVFSAYDR